MWTAYHTRIVVYFSHINTHFTFAAAVRVRSLFIPFTFTEHSLYILINWAFAVYSLHNHIYCIFTITACSLEVHFHCTFLHMHFICCCECCFSSSGLLLNRIDPVKVLLHVAMSDSSDNFSGYRFV